MAVRVSFKIWWCANIFLGKSSMCKIPLKVQAPKTLIKMCALTIWDKIFMQNLLSMRLFFRSQWMSHKVSSLLEMSPYLGFCSLHRSPKTVSGDQNYNLYFPTRYREIGLNSQIPEATINFEKMYPQSWHIEMAKVFFCAIPKISDDKDKERFRSDGSRDRS